MHAWIYSVNFGEASRHLEAARSALRAAEARLKSLGRQADTKPLELALAKMDEAQRMAGQLNQGCERAGGRRIERDQRRARYHREAPTRGWRDGTDRWFVTA